MSSVLGARVRYIVIVLCVLPGCHPKEKAVTMNSGGDDTVIMIPNDGAAKSFFEESQWNCRNIPPFLELRERIDRLSPAELVLLETGNVNEDSYGVILAARVGGGAAG